MGGSSTPVHNSKWHQSSRVVGQQLGLAINGNELVEANSTMNLSFTITRTTANSDRTSNNTINVADDAAGSYDINRLNNICILIISDLLSIYTGEV